MMVHAGRASSPPCGYSEIGDAGAGHGISVALIATKIRPAENPSGKHLSLQERKRLRLTRP
jgi:hypothetical protein